MSHASHRPKPGNPCGTRVFQNEKSPIFGFGLHFGLQIPKSILKHPSPQAPMPVWWNWQTPGTQNPVSARTCGFDPRHRHQTNIIRTRFQLEMDSDLLFSLVASRTHILEMVLSNAQPPNREGRGRKRKPNKRQRRTHCDSQCARLFPCLVPPYREELLAHGSHDLHTPLAMV